MEQNLGEIVSVPRDRGIPDLRSSVSAFPFHRGRRPRCGVRGRRPHRPGHSRPPTAAPETPGGRGASEPRPLTPAEMRGETGVVAGIWGSSQTRARSATRRPGRGPQAGSVAVGRPAGRSPGLVGRSPRRSTHGETELLARTRQPEDRLVLPKRVFGWVESAALVPVKLWLRRPIETARSSAITRVRLAGPPRRSP